MEKLKMMKNTTSGLLVTFCGLDGSGKTTQIAKLCEYLKSKGAEYFVTKQPSDAVRKSEAFRAYMDSPDHSLFDYRSLSLNAASDRLQHVKGTILPEMENGKVVISDRYYYSCLANLRARGYINDKWIYEIAESVIQPDVCFFFDVPIDVAVARVRSRPEEAERYIDIELQYRLREEYIDICLKNKGILLTYEKDINTTFEIVRKEVENLYENRKTNKKDCV